MTAAQGNKSGDKSSTSTASKPAPKNYGKIILTLQNCLLPEAALTHTPSQVDGLDTETETDLRILGCELIQTAGILLKLPQVAMATGQVYLQRFYYSKSFVRYPMETIAMGSIYLASKVEEKPCRIRDVINVFHHIKQVRAQKPISPLPLDNNYIELKNQVIKAERRILKELGFCVHVKHPHKLIVVFLQLLSYEKNRTLMQLAWNYMNDALRTDVFVRFQPETIACACIYLTARKIGLPLPNNPHWFLLFSVKEEDIQDVCLRILRLYKRTKVNSDDVERKVDMQRRIYQANKLIISGALGQSAANYIKGTEAKNKSGTCSPAGTASTKDDKKDKNSSSKSSTPPLKNHSSSSNRKYKDSRRSRSRSRDRKDRIHKKNRSPTPPRRHRSKHHHSDRSRSRDDKRKY